MRSIDGERIVIGRIVAGGVADKTRLLREGDEILEVQGVDMRGKTVNQVCDLLVRTSQFQRLNPYEKKSFLPVIIAYLLIRLLQMCEHISATNARRNHFHHSPRALKRYI